MLHLMLDSHPQIQNPGEFDFLFDKISREGEFPNVDDYKSWLDLNRIFLSKDLDVDENADYKQAITSFIEQLKGKNNKAQVLCMNIHRRFNSVPYLFEGAKYIHLIRDPRDVARSSIGMGWAGNVYYAVRQWVEVENSWSLLKSQLKNDDFLEVRYEDLVGEPSRYLKDICDFLGLSYSEEMLAYDQSSSYSRPDKKLSYQWKTKLSVRQIRYVESLTNSMIAEYGYELSGYPLLNVSLLEKSYLAIQNKFFTIKFNIKRYGFWLYVLSKITKVVKNGNFTANIKRRMNEIDISHLK